MCLSARYSTVCKEAVYHTDQQNALGSMMDTVRYPFRWFDQDSIPYGKQSVSFIPPFLNKGVQAG